MIYQRTQVRFEELDYLHVCSYRGWSFLVQLLEFDYQGLNDVQDAYAGDESQ